MTAAQADRVADRMAGRFRDEGAEIAISAPAEESTTYRGTIHLGGKTFPFTATRSDMELRGTFATGDARFGFVAILDRDRLEFRTGRSMRKLARVVVATRETEARNPFDVVQSKRPADSLGSTKASQPEGETVGHPGGFSLLVPEGWRSRKQASPVAGAGILMATPKGANPQDPNAMVMITAMPLTGPFEGITKPNDPKLRELGVLPTMTATNPATAVQLPLGAASRTEYEGTMMPGKPPVRARLHVFVLPGKLVTCLAAANAKQFAQHESSFAAIERSMRREVPAAGDPQAARSNNVPSNVPADVRNAPRDQRLVGRWRNTNSRVLRGLPGESMAISTDIFCTLAADGRYRYGSGQTGFSSSTRRGSSTGFSGGRGVETGYWKTMGNVLYIKRTGTRNWVAMGRKYGVSGRSLLIYHHNGNKVLWQR